MLELAGALSAREVKICTVLSSRVFKRSEREAWIAKWWKTHPDDFKPFIAELGRIAHTRKKSPEYAHLYAPTAHPAQ